MWMELTSGMLLSKLAEAEHEALRSAAVSVAQGDPLDEIAGQVASEWRGWLRNVGPVDRRANFIPDELLVHVLADFRYRAYTRLPGMGGLLDELRVREWERANHVREKLSEMSILPPEEDYLEASVSATPGIIVEPGILG